MVECNVAEHRDTHTYTYTNTPHLQTHTLQNPLRHTHAHTHTVQNNIKPPQYKLKQSTYRKSKSTQFLLLLIYRHNTPIFNRTFTSLHCTSPHFISPTINTLHRTPRFKPLHCTTLHFTSLHFTSLHLYIYIYIVYSPAP